MQYVPALVPLVLGATVGYAIRDEVTGPWYASLPKPSFNPPNWVFGPVWALLYVLMGVAAYRASGTNQDLSWFYVQLFLNLFWSVAFFLLKKPGLSLVDIVALVPAILLTMRSWRASEAWLLAPYLGWTIFAAVLNAWIVNSS